MGLRIVISYKVHHKSDELKVFPMSLIDHSMEKEKGVLSGPQIGRSVAFKKPRIVISDKITKLYVVGSNRLHNELLLSYIKRYLPIMGVCNFNLGSITAVVEHKDKEIIFILLDCVNYDQTEIWKDLFVWKIDNSSDCYIAFCNVKPDADIEKHALSNNVHGIFYADDPIELIPKGITAIENGEIWYPRRILASYLSERIKVEPISNDRSYVKLSNREKEILAIVVKGCSNKEIADKMNLSCHTVKTHIYNIYKKIGVDNRFQALLWASKYL